MPVSGRVRRQFDHGIEETRGIDGLVPGGTWTREIQKVGEQIVQPAALLGDDVHALALFLFEARTALQNSGSAGDAGQGIADFVGQTGRKLSQGEQPFRPFHALEIVLQLLVNLGQAVGGTFQFRALPAAALGQNAGQHARGAEEGDFPQLVDARNSETLSR